MREKIGGGGEGEGRKVAIVTRSIVGGAEQKNLASSHPLPQLILDSLTHLLLQLLLGEHGELVAEDLLRVEDLLVVHLLDERVVLDAVRLQELHVRHLESLPDRLSDELGLMERRHRIRKDIIKFK